MLTIENLKDNLCYQTHMAMSMHVALEEARQQIEKLYKQNKALLDKVAEQDKLLQTPMCPSSEHLPVGEIVERELS